jgi:hypothetical protein
MPAKYARYFIEITGVRAERLQDISDEDCIKEGIYLEHIETNFFHYHDHTSRCYCVDCEKTGRKRLIKEVLEDRELFGFDNEDDDEWIKKELDAYSVDDHTEEPITCDICGKTLSAYANDVSDKHFIECSEAYADLIGHINGKGTWESNPYVFVYDFKLIK